jgi:maltose O-acetyltransferase
MKENFIKSLFLVLYYCLFRHLPVSFSRFGGDISCRLRRWACSHIFEYCGKNVNIEKGAYFGRGDKIRIGDNSGIGINCQIPNGSIIGENVMMGPNCFVHSVNHSYERVDIPMSQQGYQEPKPVTIGDDVWIGRDVTIMVGKRIESGTIVAACSVLTKNFPEYSIVGGNPARLIKSRKE